MKKTKIIILTAIMLVSILLLSSCAASTSVSLKDLLNKDEEFSLAPDYTTGDHAPEDLDGATFVSSSGNLAYFTKASVSGLSLSVSHLVYNMVDDRVVYSGSSYSDRSVKIDLGESYFIVTVTEYKITVLEDIIDHYTTTIYDVSGSSVASARNESVQSVGPDLLYLNGKMYRYGDETVEYSFDYSKLSTIPNVEKRSENYYYEVANQSFDYCVRVYDLELNFVSRFDIPASLSVGDITYYILDNGNIFIQYHYLQPDDATDYTFLTEEGGQLKRYTLVSGIVNAADGSFAACDLPFVIADIESTDEVDYNDSLKSTELAAVGAGYKIDNKRVSNAYEMVFFRNDGSYFTIDKINGASYTASIRIAEDRWIVATAADTYYLVDEEANIIADIGNASIHGEFISGNGRIYDSDLEQLYNYEDSKVTLEKTLENAFVFKSENDVYYIYNGKGGLKEIARESDNSAIYAPSNYIENPYLIVKTLGEFESYSSGASDTYDFYNGNGDKILTINVDKDVYGSSTAVEVLAYGENVLLFSVTDSEGNTEYYTLHD